MPQVQAEDKYCNPVFTIIVVVSITRKAGSADEVRSDGRTGFEPTCAFIVTNGT
ncbi:hypothetical protein JXQ70_16705 [bacterium]|nr:hypothetical protein [bacterium]